jgi:hypothetical protein
MFQLHIPIFRAHSLNVLPKLVLFKLELFELGLELIDFS